MDIYKHITESLTLSAKLNYSAKEKEKGKKKKKGCLCKLAAFLKAICSANDDQEIQVPSLSGHSQPADYSATIKGSGKERFGIWVVGVGGLVS